MSWTNDEKPSVISDPIWSASRSPWNAAAFSYIALIWQFIPTNVWTNDSKV